MNANEHARFQALHQRYLTELTLRGKSPKTIDLYTRCLRQVCDYFQTCPDQLSTDQLQQYFMHLVQHRSWSLVKIARNALQSFYQYVLRKPWEYVPIVKAPKVQTLQDVLSLKEVERLISRTRKLSYQVYFLTTYSLGLRLSEALNLTIADVDSHLMRVHVRCGKGKKDRFVPLPLMTLKALRRYWATFRYQDSQTRRWQTLTEPASRFLWRVLQHVLPKGLRRVREYGFLHGGARKTLHRLQLRLQVALPGIVTQPRKQRVCPCCGEPMGITLWRRPCRWPVPTTWRRCLA